MLRSKLEVGEDVTGWLRKEKASKMLLLREVAERNENEELKVMGKISENVRNGNKEMELAGEKKRKSAT